MSSSKQGQLSFYKGLNAEDRIADAYVRNGFEIVQRRWKTSDGEVDLVAKHQDKLYFIEVKCSKTFDSAIAQITPAQKQRIRNAAMGYLAQTHGNLDVECRFDAALVDGRGFIRILPGALLAP
jgi:putative endonuclease